MEELEMELSDPQTDIDGISAEGMPEDPYSDEESGDMPEETLSGDAPDPEEEPEKTEPGELPGSPAETISGNTIVTVSGDAVIFPEGFDLSLLDSGTESSTGDPDAIAKAIEAQNNLFYGICAVMAFLLGIIAGILLIHGFRLRRV